MLKRMKSKLAPGFIVFRAVDIILDGAQNKHEMLYDTKKEINVKKDIVYTKNKKWKRDCKLDIYRKKTDKPQPVLFYIHGGGFDAGGKKHRRGMATWLAKTGICVVNIDYGLSPLYNFRESLAQLADAANWVSENAEKYNFNLDRVMVGGDSSGGYMALYMMALTTDASLRKVLGIGDIDLKFAGAYLNCGMFDLRKMLHTFPVGHVAGVLTYDTMGAWRHQFDSDPAAILCCPTNFINKDFPRENFFSYAQKDLLCGGQTQAVMKIYDELGIPYDEYHSTELLQNHCFMFNWNDGQCQENNDRVYAFVEKFVKNS